METKLEAFCIEDCVEAILKLFNSDFRDPINIGSEEKVSINQLVDIIENISGVKLERNYQLDKPKVLMEDQAITIS